MRTTVLFILLLCIIVGIGCEKKQQDTTDVIGEFAPEDAYLDGSKHPYYGSENAWDRRFFYIHIKDYYKRRGQRQMLDLVEGRPLETADYCLELLQKDPDDLESLFNLTVAYAHLNKPAEAMATLKHSVEKGLPFERFIAGPRDILKPLYEIPEFKVMLEKHGGQLVHGPLLGRLSSDGASFWVRTKSEVPIEVVVSTDISMSDYIKSDQDSSHAALDYTAIVKVMGLKPVTRYYYDVILDGNSSLAPDFPSFTTYPAPEVPANIRIAFGGGAGFVPQNERIWDVIRNHNPTACLLLGDNVYINMPEKPNGVIYYTYYRRQSRPEFRRLTASTPIYAIWDDHDAATDDVWLGPYRDKPVWKPMLLEVFKQNWNNPGYGTREWPGCWYNFSIDDVDFFMLDGRYYRTNPFEENPTMLGPVQKAWLKQQLLASRGAVKVIVSPVPWALASKGEARDTWNGFKAERKEIFDFLADNRIDGVILLSADRHRSDAWRIDRDNGYPLYEFESSRLTNQHFHELMPNALFGYNEKQSFGFLTINTSLDDPEITYQIISIDDEIKHTFTLRRSQISHE